MWFLRFPWNEASAAAAGAIRDSRVYRSEDGREGCAYRESGWDATELPPGAAPVKLRCLRDLPGSSAGRDAPWHYVVATDVLAAAEHDFHAWYDEEHLPGLAAVAGTVRATRYQVIEGAGPRFHACYDLAEHSAFESPQWLAVRATPWSSRVRPAFVNTRRTMYRRVDAWPDQRAHVERTSMTTPCVITCAITGSLPKKADNPAVPITAAEQIESTHEAFEAGATLVAMSGARTSRSGPRWRRWRPVAWKTTCGSTGRGLRHRTLRWCGRWRARPCAAPTGWRAESLTPMASARSACKPHGAQLSDFASSETS